MTKLFFLVLNCKRALERPLGSAPAALLAALAPVFQPRTIWVLADGVRELELERMATEGVRDQLLWLGESVDAASALTHVSPPDAGLVAERSLYLSASGALRFRAPGAPTPAWYGRWHLGQPACLWDLVTVRLEWTDETRTVELSLGLSGFPLTTVDLLRDGSLGDGDPQLAAANREDMFQALARVPGAIGVPPGGARWISDGDYAGLFPADADDVRGRWIPWLNDQLR